MWYDFISGLFIQSYVLTVIHYHNRRILPAGIIQRAVVIVKVLIGDTAVDFVMPLVFVDIHVYLLYVARIGSRQRAVEQIHHALEHRGKTTSALGKRG